MSRIDRCLLDILERLAEGIAAVVGPHCEVVVHDFSDLGHSIVIVAGNVSGRKPGAPVPDLNFISDELGSDTPDQLNYRIKIDSRNVRSSTIWLRDTDGTPIGAVCINVDYSGMLQARDLLDGLIRPTKDTSSRVISDTWAKDMDELLEHSVAGFLHQAGIPDVEAMKQEDKVRLIQMLEKRGLFQIRGAAKQLADLLNVSRASIYNYRNNAISLPLADSDGRG